MLCSMLATNFIIKANYSTWLIIILEHQLLFGLKEYFIMGNGRLLWKSKSDAFLILNCICCRGYNYAANFYIAIKCKKNYGRCDWNCLLVYIMWEAFVKIQIRCIHDIKLHLLSWLWLCCKLLYCDKMQKKLWSMWSKLLVSIYYVSKSSTLNKIKVNVKHHIREEIYIQNVLRFMTKMLCLNHLYDWS